MNIFDDDVVKYVNNFRGEYIYTMFAININGDKYIFASSACKDDNHICPECLKKVVYCVYTKRQGKDDIKLLEPLPYFRHDKNIDNCKNYGYSNEKKIKEDDFDKIKETLEQIHNSAIKMICIYLENKKVITVNKICNFTERNNNCSFEKSTLIKLEDSDIIKTEYYFTWNNNYRADIAILDKNNILKCIIEVCHTHKTEEFKRPDNIFWCDLRASDILFCNKHKLLYEVNCLRNHQCDNCVIEIKRLQIIDNEKKEAIRIKREQQCLLAIKEKEEREAMIIEKENKKILVSKYLIDKNISCYCCTSQITKFNYKWIYIIYNDENYKSDIVICYDCYMNKFKVKGLSFKNTYPEIYNKELKKIKNIRK
jgi:hypothetical protein